MDFALYKINFIIFLLLKNKLRWKEHSKGEEFA
jgi:hypothetical protein